MNAEDPVVYLNGQFLARSQAHLSVEDRGTMFADGVYEVVMYRGGRPLALDQHVCRLERSMGGIRLPASDVTGQLGEISAEVLRRNGYDNAKVYWQVTRGSAKRDHPIKPDLEPTVLVIAYPVPELDVKAPPPTVTAVLVDDERWANCWIKSLMLLPNVLAMSQARDAGADEAILHRDGIVTECSAHNVAIVRGGDLRTHPADRQILAGVTRGIMLGLAGELGITCYEQAFTTDDLFAADEALICGTTANVTAVARIDGRTIGDGQVGPITTRLHAAMMDFVARQCDLAS